MNLFLQVNKEICLTPTHEVTEEPNFALNFEEGFSTKLYVHIKFYFLYHSNYDVCTERKTRHSVLYGLNCCVF